MEPTKVLYIIGGGEFGGAEQHLLGLVKSLNQKEWLPNVAVFYEGELAQRLWELQIPVTVLTRTHPLSFIGTVAVRKLIREFKPSIIHTHGVRANLSGRLANKAEGFPAKVITTIHSILALDYPVAWKRLLFNYLEKRTWPYVNQFIVVSHAMKDMLVRDGLPEDRSVVIHNAIEIPPVPPQRPKHSTLRDELGLPQDIILVGTVARLHKVKGHTYLIQAVNQLKQTQPDAHFVFVGGGELEQELLAEVNQYSLQNRIHFLGVRQDVPDLLPQLDLFVLPSIYEGFGLVVLEAMVAGLPVITSNVGGLPEVIEEGQDGFLVPPQNVEALTQALRQALSHPEQMKKMGLTGQQKVFQHNSLERLMLETTNLYKKILNQV